MSSVVEIVLQGKDNASSVIGGLQDKLGGLGDVARGALTVGLGIGTAAVGALAAGLALSINEALDAQKIQAQLTAVLKSTGGAAGVTADKAIELANALSKTSTFTDEQILSGENLLLTFTNIGKDVFPQATQTLLDMASAMGGDAKSNAIQLGKALNDPVAGISALTRVGVTFSEEQKKVIAKLVETGDVAGAQKIILAELAKEFGGSAAAQAQTFSGQMEVVKNQLMNVAEGIGTALLPILQTLVNNVITPALPVIEALGTVFAGAITDFVSSGGDLGVVIDDIREGLTGIIPQPLLDQFVNFINFFRTNGPTALKQTETALQPVILAAQNVANAFIQSMPMIQKYVSDMVTFVLGLFRQMSPELITNVTTTLNSLAEFWRNHGEQIMAVINFAFRVIATTIGGTLVLVSGIIASALQLINGDWQGAWNTVVNTLKTFMNMALSIVGTNLDEFISVWRKDFEMAQLIITTVFNLIVSTIKEKVTAFVTAIQTGVAQVKLNIATTFNDILNGIRDKVNEFVSVGQAIIDGIKQGIGNAVSGLVQSAIQAVMSALDAAKNALGIHSPSTAFAEVGKNIMAGMSQGITQGTQGTLNAMNNSVSQITNNYNNTLEIHSNANTESVIGGFSMLRALYGGT